MLQFALVCVALYTVMSAAVGVRLILRGVRSQHSAELLMGLAYLAAPGIGYPLVVGSSVLSDSATSLTMFGIGQALIVLGCTCFFFFNARVFRPGVALAQGGAALAAVVMAFASSEIIRGHMALGNGALGLASVRTASVTMVLVLGCAYSWTGYEGFRHYRMMRRRATVGLGDPVVANRFLLWAIAGSLQVISALVTVQTLRTGGNIAADAAPVLATSLVGVFNSVLLVLIFMPPARYVRWLTRDPRGALAAV